MIKLHVMCLTHYNYVIGFTQYLQLSPTHKVITLTIQIFTCVADLDFCWHIQRCELFQTKMTSLKIFLVLVLVHESKFGFIFSKDGILYFGLVLVSILKWWTPLLKYVLVLVLVYQNNTKAEKGKLKELLVQIMSFKATNN